MNGKTIVIGNFFANEEHYANSQSAELKPCPICGWCDGKHAPITATSTTQEQVR